MPIVAWTIWKPGALRVPPRVEEAEDARAAVRLDPDRERARAPSARSDAIASSRIGHAGDEEDREHHPAERDRRSEVGLDDDQPAEERREQAERLHELAERPRRAPPREVDGREEAERELRELGRLEARRARRGTSGARR